MTTAGPPWAPELRYLTEGEPPIPLRFRERHEDFRVDEILSFEPSEEGEHLLLRIEKRGLSTPDLVQHLAQRLEIGTRDIGWAGRKDARAVTRQWFSVPARCEGLLESLPTDSIHVLSRARNDRKLRLGALAGNRFELLLRGVAISDRSRVERSLKVLERRGLPNYFGSQRFGRRGFAFELGRALVRGAWREHLLDWTSPRHGPETAALAKLHGMIASGRGSELRRARDLVGDLPREYVSVAHQLARRRGDWRNALRAVERRTLSFHVSAYQSYLFNRVLSARLESFDQPERGDLVQRHPGKSFFQYDEGEDPVELAQRAERGELSPTGPLPGASVDLAQGRPGELERAILSAEAALPEAFAEAPLGQRPPGERRSLRVMPQGLQSRFEGEELRLSFVLPPGSFATVLLGELTKDP